MGQHGLVGFEDDVVLRALALAVMMLGDLPQIVALLDSVEHRRLGFLDDGEIALDLRHADGITERQNDLLGFFGGLRIAREDNLVAFNLYVDARDVETMLFGFLLEFWSRSRLSFARTKNLRANRFGKTEQELWRKLGDGMRKAA